MSDFYRLLSFERKYEFEENNVENNVYQNGSSYFKLCNEFCKYKCICILSNENSKDRSIKYTIVLIPYVRITLHLRRLEAWDE